MIAVRRQLQLDAVWTWLLQEGSIVDFLSPWSISMPYATVRLMR